MFLSLSTYQTIFFYLPTRSTSSVHQTSLTLVNMRFFEYLAVLALAAGTANAAAARIAIYPDENYNGTPQQFTTQADNRCCKQNPPRNTG